MSAPPRIANVQIVTTSASISAWRRSRSAPPRSARTKDRRGRRQRPLRSTPPKIEIVNRFGERRGRGGASARSPRRGGARSGRAGARPPSGPGTPRRVETFRELLEREPARGAVLAERDGDTLSVGV